MSDKEDIARLVAGIAAYKHQQNVFLRLLRKRGSFTSAEFNKWFLFGKRRHKNTFTPISGDTFILGIGVNGGNRWAEMLDLLQIMVAIGIVDAKEDSNGLVVYTQSI